METIVIILFYLLMFSISVLIEHYGEKHRYVVQMEYQGKTLYYEPSPSDSKSGYWHEKQELEKAGSYPITCMNREEKREFRKKIRTQFPGAVLTFKNIE